MIFGIALVIVAIIALIILKNKRNTRVQPEQVEQTPASQEKLIAESVGESTTESTAQSSIKRRIKSTKGMRLNRTRRHFSEIDSDLFDMTFPGIYHPHRALFLHDWYLDNYIDGDDDYEIELDDEDFGYSDVVVANIYREGDDVLVAMLNTYGEVVDIARFGDNGALTIGDTSYFIDEDTGVVSVVDGDSKATYSDELGYTVNTGVAEDDFEVSESNYANESEIENSVAEVSVDELVETAETVEPVETDEIIVTKQEPETFVDEANASEESDISTSVESSGNEVAY